MMRPWFFLCLSVLALLYVKPASSMPGTSEEGSAHSGDGSAHSGDEGSAHSGDGSAHSGDEGSAHSGSTGGNSFELPAEASPQMAGGEIQNAPQFPPSPDSTDEDQTYEPRLHGPKPCRNKKPTPQDNKFCQDDCDHKYSTPPRQVGTASWTVGKCKGKKCKCTFNYAAYGKWIKLKDRVTTMGDPNKLKKLVMKRCDREAKGGSSGGGVVDESTTLERFDLD